MPPPPAPLVALGRPGSRLRGRPLVAWEGPAPARILVLRFSALGDVVLITPALEALRRAFPEAHIAVATKARLLPLLEHNPVISQLIPLPEGEGVRAFARRLAEAGPFDALLDLHGKLRSLALRLLLPRPRRTAVWTARDRLRTLPAALLLAPARAEAPTADCFHAAAEELAGRALPRGTLRVFPDPAAVTEVLALLRGAGFEPGQLGPRRPLLGLSPGAAWATKAWPAARWAELAARALREGVQVVVQGSEAERPLGREIAAAVRALVPAGPGAPGLLDLCGALDVRGLVALVSRCTAFVAGDTGPMHVARAQGVPTVAIFGSTDPGMFEWGGHRALTAPGVACAPCSFYGRKRCPRGHLRCLTGILVPPVWEAVAAALREGGERFVSA